MLLTTLLLLLLMLWWGGWRSLVRAGLAAGHGWVWRSLATLAIAGGRWLLRERSKEAIAQASRSIVKKRLMDSQQTTAIGRKK